MARLEFCASDVSGYAAEGIAVDPLLELGLMYCTGRDVGVDLVQAHKWLNLSAVRGNPEAKRLRGEISSEMSKAEIARAQRLAREWLAVN